jgi:hypothetical protein
VLRHEGSPDARTDLSGSLGGYDRFFERATRVGLPGHSHQAAILNMAIVRGLPVCLSVCVIGPWWKSSVGLVLAFELCDGRVPALADKP